MVDKNNINTNSKLSDSQSLAIQIMVSYNLPFSFDTINKFDKEIRKSLLVESK